MGWYQVGFDHLFISCDMLTCGSQVGFGYLFDAFYDSWAVGWLVLHMSRTLVIHFSVFCYFEELRENWKVSDKNCSASNKNIAHAHYLFGCYKCAVSPHFPCHLLLSPSHFGAMKYSAVLSKLCEESADIAHVILRVLRSCTSEHCFFVVVDFFFRCCSGKRDS